MKTEMKLTKAKIGVYKNFAKFTRKHLCQSLLFNKVASELNSEHLFELVTPEINAVWRMLYFPDTA